MSEVINPVKFAEPEAPTEAAPEAAKPVEPYAVFSSEDSLKTRMERHTRSTLKKEFGVESSDELKLKFAKLAELEAREEEQRKASMTREQQLQEEIEKMKAQMNEAMTLAEKAKFDAHTTRLYSKLGLKNADYATFKLASAVREEGFSDEAYLSALLEDPRERVALGVDEPAAAQPKTVTVGATTTSLDNISAPKPPKAGAPETIKSAYDLTPQEWQKRKQLYGLG